MARFVFKLQSFLSVKEKMEDQKKLEYGRSLAALELEKQKKAKLLLEQDTQLESFRDQIKTKIDPQAFIIYNDYIALLKKKISEQQKAIEYAQVFVENKRVELVEAMKERKMLTTLKENEHIEFIRQEQIAEQKVTDEIVSYRYNNR